MLLLWASGAYNVAFSADDNATSFFNDANSFLAKYVIEGCVDYHAIQNNTVELRKLVRVMENMDLSKFSHNEQKAFWINAYNLTVINSIIHHWPIKSPMDVSGFFDKLKHTIASEKLTINDIENKKIRAVYNDPRIHFVLVCAAMGCPKIISEAYFPEKLEAQLEARTKATLNDPSFIRIRADDDKTLISEIFKWYKEDFTGTGKSVLQYINQYRINKIPSNYSVSHYTYDWALNKKKRVDDLMPEIKDQPSSVEKPANLQEYTPSALLKKGQVEVKLFNNLYTDNAGFDQNGVVKESSKRQNYFSGFLQTAYGIAPKLNVGVDAILKSVSIDDVTSSPLELFTFENTSNTRTALSYIGPKIKISPFKKLNTLSIQSTLFFPLASDQQGQQNGKPYLSHDGYQWWVQVFYDQKISEKFRAFFEVDAITYIDRKLKKDNSFIDTPVKAFLSFFPTHKVTLYLLTEWAPTWGDNAIASYYSQVGIGGKYQLLPNLEIELLYTNFPLGKNKGAGTTYNLGLRFLR
ncbi:MAG: hypothetical protein COA57_07255 [Flavobacteriales bacterium]|nr:MAG: hypothetical protein COA57_07255 [Flavobacteriales bacterium]